MSDTTEEEYFVSAKVNPPTAIRLQPGLTAVLHHARALYDDRQVRSVELEVDLTAAAFDTAFTQGWLGLSAQSQGPNLIEGDFDAERPRRLKLRLKTPYVVVHFPLGDTEQMQQALYTFVGHLLDPPESSDLATVEALTYVTVMQDMGGGVLGGYRNLNFPQEP